MRDVERVVDIDVAVGNVLEVVEDVGLEGDRRLHNEGVEIEPPEPRKVSNAEWDAGVKSRIFTSSGIECFAT